MEEQKLQTIETIILVLGRKRIEVSREKLAQKSLYFASLFSHNFSDSLQKEYAINYDVAPAILQNFVDWITEDVACVRHNDHHVKLSLAKYMIDDFAGLLQLLQLSVLLTAESLIEELTDIIIRHWLLPHRMLDIWTLAEELGLTVLRDVSKAACLDRFQDLPVPSLMELPKESFMQLTGNANVRATDCYLLHLAQKWIQRNDMLSDKDDVLRCIQPLTATDDVCTEDRMEDESLLQSCAVCKKETDRRKPKYIQCVVGHKLCKNNETKACIYTWNGETLSELVELKITSPVPGKKISGMQVVGLGFDIYTIGGEWGLGSGRFNMDIWRYCTLSKKWYFVERLPEPRRHMAVAFLKEKLMIMGGVGRHRLKLSTVDVLDIRTGEWTKAAEVPEEFTNVPPTSDMGGTLLLYKSEPVIYDPKRDIWNQDCTFEGDYVECKCHEAKLLMEYGNIFVIGISKPNQYYLWEVNRTSHPEVFEHYQETTVCCNSVLNGRNLISISYENGSAVVRTDTVKVTNKRVQIITLQRYREKRADIHDLCSEAPMGCFNIIDPKSLHERFIPSHKGGNTTEISSQ